MTDRYSALIVILDHDIRDDDAEMMVNAIKQLKGVLDVRAHLANPDTDIAAIRLKVGLIEKLIKVVNEQ